jgi:hypothetical protein
MKRPHYVFLTIFLLIGVAVFFWQSQKSRDSEHAKTSSELLEPIAEDALWYFHGNKESSNSDTHVYASGEETVSVPIEPSMVPQSKTPEIPVPLGTPTFLGLIPFACGPFIALDGYIEWETVALFEVDCETDTFSFRFRGTDNTQTSAEFSFDQKIGQIVSSTNVQGCVSSGSRVYCPSFNFDVIAIPPTGISSETSLYMPIGCGEMHAAGIIDWKNIAKLTMECAESRLELSFRNPNPDEARLYVNTDPGSSDNIYGYTNTLGCTMGRQSVTDSKGEGSIGVERLPNFEVFCADYDIKFSVSRR